MKRDEKNYKFAVDSRYSYVLCDDEGNIMGWGLTKKTLEYHNKNHYNIMTVKQYAKATAEATK